MLSVLSREKIDRAVRQALEEDCPFGDLTACAIVDENAQSEARLVAREPGILAGRDVFEAAFKAQNPSVSVEFQANDGDSFAAGDCIATVSGPVRDILTAERVALNFVQHMSGIASYTGKFVEAVRGTKARIADTRKTTPGLRCFEKYAVSCGGGINHRMSLSDAVMIKDNHCAFVQQSGLSLSEAVRLVRSRVGHTVCIEVEVDGFDQISQALDDGADVIMLDNFSVEDMRRSVDFIAGRAVVEASGNMSLERVPAVAATGVDVISVGALTHSVRAVDLGLDV